MKASHSFLSKLFVCASLVFLISSTVHAAPADMASTAKANSTDSGGNLDEDAYVDALADALDSATLGELGALGAAFVSEVGAQGDFFESIAFEVLSAAVELGASASQMAAIQTALAEASPDPDAAGIALNAYSDASGVKDPTARKGGAGSSAPVAAGAPAGGQTLPAGCSPEDYVCISRELGITVEEARIAFPPSS